MRDQLEQLQDGGADEYPGADREDGTLTGPNQKEGQAPEYLVKDPATVIIEPTVSRSPVELAEKSQWSDDGER